MTFILIKPNQNKLNYMRTIKFRCWDIKNKLWINNLGMKPNNVLTNGTEKLWDVMQFTGLTDKNGKEVFEGDVVKVEYGTGKVEHSDSQAMFIIVWIDDPEANTEPLAYEPDKVKYGRTRNDIEIIGNVFENPELL